MLLAGGPLLLGLMLQPALHGSTIQTFRPVATRSAIQLQDDMDAMPAELGEWGCDEELWSKIRGAKGSLRKLAREGNEGLARKRIQSIRTIVQEEEANPGAAEARRADAAQKVEKTAKQTVETAEQRREKFSNPRAAGAKGARPLKAGYELVGDLPAGYDAEPIEAMVKERQAAKIARDFELADALQVKLQAKGVRLDDRRRTWSIPS